VQQIGEAMQHYAARRIAHQPEPESATAEHAPHTEHAAFLEDRRMALAAAAVLCTGVLVASYFLIQGARNYALATECAVPSQASCDRFALN
jgi:hypothetical protein